MALVGYGRVSSTGQSLDIQLEHLKAIGCDPVFAEKRTGTTTAGRDQLEEALRYLRRGDVLCATKMNRLGRSVADISNMVAELDKRGVGLRILDQSGIDTTTANGRLMLNMLAAFAEFETEIRKERQRDGINRAKSEGVYTGRKATLDPVTVRKLKAEGCGATEIAKRLGISRASVYRFLGEVATT